MRHKGFVAATLLLAEDVNLGRKSKGRKAASPTSTQGTTWPNPAKPSPGALTWASTFWWGCMEPGLTMTKPRLKSSRFRPRTRAPRLSPASALSRLLWNISMPRKKMGGKVV